LQTKANPVEGLLYHRPNKKRKKDYKHGMKVSPILSGKSFSFPFSVPPKNAVFFFVCKLSIYPLSNVQQLKFIPQLQTLNPQPTTSNNSAETGVKL
jgi:hypothetical protein